MANYKRANYLRREAELAHRNAKAADTLGRYAEASWWEERAQELINELKRVEGGYDMTMSNEEIAREYRTAKDGLKQAKILAELNQCSKEKIVEILQEQGVKVDGRLLQKGKPHASLKPKSEAEAAPAAPEDPKPQHDPVNHPDHYTRGGIECIDAIAAAVQDLPGKEAWLVGQIIKYVWRYRWKNGAEDLKKARFYLDRLIQEAEA